MFGILFTVIIIMPVAIVFGGVVLKQCADSDISQTIGYRTKRSMKSKELWQLANRTCAELWITGGIIITVFSVALPFVSCLFLNETAGLYVSVFTLIAQVAAFILSIVKVENKLKLYDNENSK